MISFLFRKTKVYRVLLLIGQESLEIKGTLKTSKAPLTVEKVYKKMITYLDYVQEQENMLSLTETKKDNYAKTFFEQDTQDTNEIVNTIKSSVK